MNDRTKPMRGVRSSFRLRSCLSITIIFLMTQGQSACSQHTDATQADLTTVFYAAQDLRQPQLTNGIPDYTIAAVERQKIRLAKILRQSSSVVFHGSML